ncbi:restriction endonuclease subunit S [Ectopseudomonas mendocina]
MLDQSPLSWKQQKSPSTGWEWFGKVPQNWIQLPLCAIAKIKSIANQKDEDLLSVYLELGVVKFDDIDEKRTNATSADLSSYQLVDVGDFVLNNQQAWRGSVGVSKFRGIVSPAYLVFELDKRLDSRFANYLFRDGSMVSQYLISSKGVGTIQRNLYWAHLKRAVVYLPPISEQVAIADFLDGRAMQIDQAIQIKERQIELLKERKQILIQQAVTHGLDPHAPMRDSGIEWIGQIPAHWEVVFNRRIFREKSRPVQGDELPLSLSQVDGVIPSDEMTERSLSPAHRKNFKRCIPGDLVVNRFKGHLGVFFESAYDGVVTFHYGVFEPQKGVVTKYFEHLFHTEPYKTIYAGASNGMTIGLQNLSNSNFYAIKSLLPSVDEQAKICGYIEDHSAPINQVINNISSQIERLREYKATLINSAVTGKIKVPGVVEPTEIEEREFA